MENTKYCKHCGETIDADCVVCTKCGKQVEVLASGQQGQGPIVINNNNSASSSAAASAAAGGFNNRPYIRKMPWYLSWFWIFILGTFTGGIYWIVGFILRVNWKSKN